MAVNVFDTSALGKHYHPEIGGARVDQLLGVVADVQAISRFSVVELHSVFAKKVRTGEISIGDFNAVARRFRSDVAAKRLRVIRLLVTHFQLAERLLRRHALTRNLRTLDALQLAVAIRLNAINPIQFICADQPLCAIAVSEGLSVVNPEIP
jgi:uncharacterized protein